MFHLVTWFEDHMSWCKSETYRGWIVLNRPLTPNTPILNSIKALSDKELERRPICIMTELWHVLNNIPSISSTSYHSWSSVITWCNLETSLSSVSSVFLNLMTELIHHDVAYGRLDFDRMEMNNENTKYLESEIQITAFTSVSL